ncbi:MAG: response regulator [Dehalococcoidia bacterium]
MAALNKALIVDDEESIRYFLSELLSGFGFDCEEAASADQALTALEADDFGLMLLDVRMPGMSGLELLRLVREQGNPIRVVVLSALGDPEVAAEAVTSLGANAFIGKPCSVDELQQTVERILRD